MVFLYLFDHGHSINLGTIGPMVNNLINDDRT